MGWYGQANSLKINQIKNYNMTFIILFIFKFKFHFYIIIKNNYLRTYGQHTPLTTWKF